LDSKVPLEHKVQIRTWGLRGLELFLKVACHPSLIAIQSYYPHNPAGKRNRRFTMIITTSRKGYVLIATAFGMTVVLGAAGLAVDIGRAYVARRPMRTQRPLRRLHS
jgi:hypothetical protein